MKKTEPIEKRNLLAEFLHEFTSQVWLVGSRGANTHRPDSDVDLHLIDMLQTDRTFDTIIEWSKEQHLQFHVDKWETGSITIPEQHNFPLACDIGYWMGIPHPPKLTSRNVVGVQLSAPAQKKDRTQKKV